MEYDLIETPENVELEQRLAGIGTRFMAGLVDTCVILLGLLVTVLLLVLGQIAGALSVRVDAARSPWLLALLIVGFLLLFWGYFVLFELFTNGQSAGKRYMRIRVVKEGGGAIGFSEIAIRNLLRPVDGFPFYPVAGVVMFLTRKTQRLGDLTAGTVVISEAVRDYSASGDRPKQVDWTTPVSADDLRKTRLTPDEFRLLASYQRRRDELTIEARRQLLGRILPPILTRLGRPIGEHSLDALDWHVDALLDGDHTDWAAADWEERP